MKKPHETELSKAEARNKQFTDLSYRMFDEYLQRPLTNISLKERINNVFPHPIKPVVRVCIMTSKNGMTNFHQSKSFSDWAYGRACPVAYAKPHFQNGMKFYFIPKI